jgi:quercetin dioxygenase-like cupin family protein
VKVRRVVTGHDKNGKAVFASDTDVEPITASLVPGAEFHRLWGGDTAPAFPDSGAMPSYATYFPPVGGFRFSFFSLAPRRRGPAEAGVATVPDPAALSEFEAKLPGLAKYLEPDTPGMHTTPTIDFEVVLSGEVVLELDDGASVTLRAGDTVVQNGTRHRWRNAGDIPAVVAVFICGAHHARVRSSLSSGR